VIKKLLMLRHSSRMRELNDSTWPLRHGSPGGMKCKPILTVAESAIALQANSGPLSQRSTAGNVPRSAANRVQLVHQMIAGDAALDHSAKARTPLKSCAPFNLRTSA
jgi:hypothetical protein